MKENVNYLTAALIAIFIAALSYNYINKEKVETTKDSIEQEESIEIDESLVEKEKSTPISQVVIRGKIKWAKNTVDSHNRYYREARFFTRDTSITTKLDWRGGFNLTFPLDSSGYITFHHGNETTAMYCNPDDTVHITIDTKQFDETITYTGSDESNYLAQKFLYFEEDRLSQYVINYEYTNSFETIEGLSTYLDSIYNNLYDKLAAFNGSYFYNSEKQEYNDKKERLLELHEKFLNLPKIGDPAIDFTYPDIEGNIISLSDFKGSYVYVDVWATWCWPCRYQIPFLSQLEKDYHDSNIVFMSVSVDEEKDKQSWVNMIEEQNMGGVQLFAAGWNNTITQNYLIRGIPRFMLFDTKGNVISLNAARPSSDEIREIFDGLFNNIEEESVEEKEMDGEDVEVDL